MRSCLDCPTPCGSLHGLCPKCLRARVLASRSAQGLGPRFTSEQIATVAPMFARPALAA